MKNTILLALSVIVLAFAWHMLLFAGRTPMPYVHVNPVTDMMTVSVPLDRSIDRTLPGFNRGFIWGINQTGDPETERKTADFARSHFDIYAMVLPWRVTFVEANQ